MIHRSGTLLCLAGCLLSSSVLGEQRHGPVQPGEGVYEVAVNYRDRSGDLSLHKWALAIYALNQEAFRNGLASLQQGAHLRIPTEAQVREHWARGKQLLGETPQGGRSAFALAEMAVPVPEPYFSEYGWFASQDAAAPDVPVPESLAAEAPPDGPAGELPADMAQAARFADDPLYQTARQTLRGGEDVAPVLAQMNESEPRFAGDADFDYLHGILLLQAGRPHDAVFPLLRAARAQRGNLGVRIDLGRAYYEMGENESARQIFDDLARRDPPPEAAAVIDSYRQAIERRAARYERRWTSLLAVDGGFDSNANSASDLLSFAGFLLEERARSTESPYTGLAAQSRLSNPLAARWQWLLSGDAATRQYSDASELSTLQWSLGTGLKYRLGELEWSGQIAAAQRFVDGEDNSQVVSLTGALRGELSPTWRYRLGAQLGALRYSDALRVRDVDQWLLSGGASQRFRWAHGAELGADLIVGVDEAAEAGSPYGRDLIGAGLTGLLQATPQWRIRLSTHLLSSDYDGSFFGLARSDVQWFTAAGLQMTHNRWPDWQLGLDASYVDNRSDVDLFEYDRVDLRLRLGRVFD